MEISIEFSNQQIPFSKFRGSESLTVGGMRLPIFVLATILGVEGQEVGGEPTQ